MFESADLAHEVKKSLYKREEPKLREQLLAAQSGVLADGSFAVLILIAGVQGAGRGQTVNLLNEWMDPRHVQTRGFGEPTQDERERPEAWRYWNALPPKGKIGVFFGAWHTEPIMRRVHGETSDDEFAHEIAQVLRLERMLADEGVLLLKYWFHISKAEQKKRLRKAHEKLEAPYKKFAAVSEAFLRRTATPEAPWTVIPGYDARYRALTFGRHLLAAIETRLAGKTHKRPAPLPVPRIPPASNLNVIRALHLSQPMSKSGYRDELERWQARLTALSQKKSMRRVS